MRMLTDNQLKDLVRGIRKEQNYTTSVNYPAIVALLKEVVKIGPNGRMYESTVKQAQLLLRSFGEDKE